MTEFMRFSGKNILITGATSGIGKAVALAFAREGGNMVVTGRNSERGQGLAESLLELGAKVKFISGDISKDEFCRSVVDQTIEYLGSIDIVVNSAGVIFHATAEETSDQQWHETFNTNVNAVFYICRAAIPHMKQLGGVVINIASDAALSGSYHLAAYCASKGAVLQLSRSMAKDFARDNIRVVPICPGDVDTPMLRGEFQQRGIETDTGLQESAEGVPLNRVATAAEVAELVLYASSDAAKFITGYPLVMDGGNRA